jgi:hypothetical protein
MTMPRFAFAPVAVLLIAACSALGPGGRSPSPSGAPPSASAVPSSAPSAAASRLPSPGSTAIDVSRVTSAAQAAALVFASNPLFSSIEALRPHAVGQSSWYEAFESGDGFNVTVNIGSGDCEAGCINKHSWIYSVSRSGKIALVDEQGPEVEVPTNHGTSDPATVIATLVAGPVCPVERNPPDPSCAPRPVDGGVVVLRDASAAEVDQAIAGPDGRVEFSVPGGSYYLDPQPVQGLMGVAAAVAFSVVGGDTVGVSLAYDTGIR